LKVEYLRDGKALKAKAYFKDFAGDTDVVKRYFRKTMEFEGVVFE